MQTASLYTAPADGDRSPDLTDYDGQILETAAAFGLAVVLELGYPLVLGEESNVRRFMDFYRIPGEPTAFSSFPEPKEDPGLSRPDAEED